MRIPYQSLRLGRPVGSGSQGTIYRVEPDPALGFAFPLIYKEFNAKTVVAGASLEILARFRADLSERDLRVIDRRTVWPVAVVEKQGRISGYLMQAIPDNCMQTIRTMDGSEPIPREVQHLFVADDLARKNIGEVPTRIERLALARETAFAFGFLHKREFVFGDFSYKNAVYTLRPEPMVMLLDCDAVRQRGQGAAVAQLNSPGWGAPEKGPQTIESDRYKLGLFILRCLTPGVNAQSRDATNAAAVLDTQGMALLRQALGDDPAARPSGKAWVQHLDRRIAVAGGVPVRGAGPAQPGAPPRVASRATPIDARAVSTRPRRGATSATTRRPGGVAAAQSSSLPRSTLQPGATGKRPAQPFGAPRRFANWVPPRRVRSGQVRSHTTGRTLFNRGQRPTGAIVARSRLIVAFLALVALAAVATILALTGSSSKPRATTSTTARSSTSGVGAGTTSAAIPTTSAAVANASSAAVDRVSAMAGAGWTTSALTESLVQVKPTDPVRVVWYVDMAGPPAVDGAGKVAQMMRTYSVDDAAVTELRSVNYRSGATGLPTLVGGWPVAEQRALDLVMTPTRSNLVPVIRFGCAYDRDDHACAWEVRFVRGSAVSVQSDRVYVTPDGAKTMSAPAWAPAL